MAQVSGLRSQISGHRSQVSDRSQVSGLRSQDPGFAPLREPCPLHECAALFPCWYHRDKGCKLLAQVSGLRSRISDLRSQISDLISHISYLRFQISDLRSQISGLRSQISDLRSQISDLKSQVSGLKSQDSGLRSQAPSCRDRGSGRLLDDPQQVCAGDGANILGGLALGVVEVGWDSYHNSACVRARACARACGVWEGGWVCIMS